MKNQKTLRQGSKQRGASMPLVLAFVGMAAMWALVGFKIYPIYFEHWQLQSVAQSFEDEAGLSDLSVGEISKRFRLRMQTNNIRDINYADAVTIEADDGVLSIIISYESRVNVYKSIDAVLVFDEVTEINY